MQRSKNLGLDIGKYRSYVLVMVKHIVLIFWLSYRRDTFIELYKSFWGISWEFMVESPAVTETCIIWVTGSVLSILNEFFCLIQLVISSEKIDKFC